MEPSAIAQLVASAACSIHERKEGGGCDSVCTAPVASAASAASRRGERSERVSGTRAEHNCCDTTSARAHAGETSKASAARATILKWKLQEGFKSAQDAIFGVLGVPKRGLEASGLGVGAFWGLREA